MSAAHMSRLRLGSMMVTALACGGSALTPAEGGGSHDEITLVTDREVYTAVPSGGEGAYRSFSVTVIARFVNDTDQPLYLERCYPDTPYPIFGVIPADGGSEAAYNPNWACVGHYRQIVVQPGEARSDSLPLTGPNRWDGRTHEPSGPLTGRFRVAYRAGTCPEIARCERASVAMTSNAFEVQLDA